MASSDSCVSSVPHGAFRLDVREATRAAAAGEFQFNRTCLALVSVDLVNEWSDWSEPVELKIVRNEDGLLDIEVRSASGV